MTKLFVGHACLRWQAPPTPDKPAPTMMTSTCSTIIESISAQLLCRKNFVPLRFLWQSPGMLYARRFISAVVVLSFCAIQSIGQQATKEDDAYAVLIDGLGTYSRPISTRSEIAQKFFDQGLRLVYGYYSPEATASFREAIRHDPESPMLYWGLALALGPIP